MKKIRVISCITTIMIMALIFFFSSQNSEDSSEVSKGVAALISEFIARLLMRGEESAVLAENIHHFIRKTAHFTIYMSLGVSSFIMLLSNFKRGYSRTAVGTGVFCALYAASDEFHQLFSEGRSAKLTDICIDTSGAVLGILICITVLFLVNRADFIKGRGNEN